MRSVREQGRGRGGWTQLQVLVLLVVLVTAIGLVIVVVNYSRAPSYRVECAMRLKHLGDTIHVYHGNHKTLPASCVAPGYATWAVQVGQVLRQDEALKPWDLGLPYYQQPDTVRQAQIWLYYCPARRFAPQLSTSGDVPAGDVAAFGVARTSPAPWAITAALRRATRPNRGPAPRPTAP